MLKVVLYICDYYIFVYKELLATINHPFSDYNMNFDSYLLKAENS
jgi:hypothetical protein